MQRDSAQKLIVTWISSGYLTA